MGELHVGRTEICPLMSSNKSDSRLYPGTCPHGSAKASRDMRHRGELSTTAVRCTCPPANARSERPVTTRTSSWKSLMSTTSPSKPWLLRMTSRTVERSSAFAASHCQKEALPDPLQTHTGLRLPDAYDSGFHVAATGSPTGCHVAGLLP